MDLSFDGSKVRWLHESIDLLTLTKPNPNINPNQSTVGSIDASLCRPLDQSTFGSMTVGSMATWTYRPSDPWPPSSIDRRIHGNLDLSTVGSMASWIYRPSDPWPSGSIDRRIRGHPDLSTVGSMITWIYLPLDPSS